MTIHKEKELLMLLELDRQDRTKENYATYVQYVHEGRWFPSKHLVYICNTIQDFIEGKLDKKIRILILQVPPQHGKSMTVTETLPSWYLGKYPTKRVIEASYGDDLAQRFGRRNKDKIEKFGKKLFNIEISKKTSASTEFELSNGIGGMISRGIMSGITGQPAELIIIDDPIKNRSEADSETYRNKLWEEYLNSINTRFSADGKLILIQTRWHEDDLAGRLIKNLPNMVHVINLPCEAEENDLLDRNIGDALFPEIGKNNEWLKDYKEIYKTAEGSRAWNALFQGRPTAQEGNLIKREWWKYYKVLPQIAYKIMSVDASVKAKETSDFVSIQIWGKSQANMYLIDRLKARMDFPTTVKSIKLMKVKHPDLNAIYIEDKANGSPIIQVLRNEIGGIIPVNPIGDKVYRVNAISGYIESGNCYLPENAEFTLDFVEECSAFPNGTHDDDVDAMSQAILKIKDVPANLPIGNKPRDDLGIFYNDDYEEGEPDQTYIEMTIRRH
jgi:predicted phage terminase large subunit-like protein